MGTLITDIKEADFVRKSTASYDLSILVGMDRFFYAIYDGQQNLLVLRCYQFDVEIDSLANLKDPIQRVFLSDKLLQLPFYKTRMAFLNNKATLVPERLYDSDQKATYLQHLLELKDSDHIGVDFLSILDANLVYALDENFLKEIRSYFPNASVYHAFTPLLLGYRRVMQHQSGSQIFLHVKDGLLQLVLFDGSKLQFCNSFPYQSSKDFIYFVMLIFDQFNLKPESTPVHLSGMIEVDSEIYQNLFRYIRHINFMAQPAFIRFGNKSNELKNYFFYDLFCLKLCE